MNLFSSLAKVQKFSILSSTMKGKGCVRIEKRSADSLAFYEKGTWKDGTIFTNQLFFELRDEKIDLSHFRYTPTKLVTFSPRTPSHFLSTAHLCIEDQYTAEITCSQKEIKLLWNIRKKGVLEKLEILYLI
jgi:hypothetical protein